MNRLENKIRDFLALNIEILGKNLTIVDKEFPLKNPDGAGGSIDLLAKDQFGHFVIIELKRSDQAARAALHELAKYTALLRSQMGLRRDQLRVMLVSTEWHELAVPFSEYLEVCVVPTEGVQIAVDPQGVVLSTAPFKPIDISEPLSLSRMQDIVLFESEADRNCALAKFVSSAAQALLSDFSVFNLDYSGGNKQVIYPYGLYLVFSSPLEGLDGSDAATLKGEIDWDDDLEELDENFLVEFRRCLGPLGDESGIGYPEKLAKIESDGWRVTVVHRAGRYAGNTALVPDDALILEAKKTEGGAAFYYARVASPKFGPGWGKVKTDIKLVLLGDAKWTRIVLALLDEIEKKHPSATVSISVYNLANIVFGLVKYFRFGDQSYLPTLQLVVEDIGETNIYFGGLAWTGQLTRMSGSEWIRECFESEDNYMLRQHFGETFEVDDMAKRKLGLQSFVVEVRGAGAVAEEAFIVDWKSKSLCRSKMSNAKFRSLSDFHRENQGFGQSLVVWAGTVATGWV